MKEKMKNKKEKTKAKNNQKSHMSYITHTEGAAAVNLKAFSKTKEEAAINTSHLAC